MKNLNTPLFKALFETDIPKVIVKSNQPNFDVIACNQAYQILSGLTDEELVNRSFWMSYPVATSDEEKEKIALNFAKAITENQEQLFISLVINRLREKENLFETQQYQVKIVPILENDNSTQENLLFISFRNITNSILSANKLHSSLQREADLSLQLAKTNEDLAAANEELQASIEELLKVNTALNQSREELKQLNTQLEERVIKRTHDLEDSKQMLQNIIQNSPVAMTLLSGKDLIISNTNPPMLKIWQKPVAEMDGRKLLDIFPELNAPYYMDVIENIFNNGQNIARKEIGVEVDIADGKTKTIYVDFYYNPIFDAQYQVAFILLTAVEVTESVEVRKALEQNKFDLQATTEELATSNEELAAINEELATINQELKDYQENLFHKNEALSHAEESLRLALESGNLGTYSIDLKTSRFDISARAREFYGLDDKKELFWQDVIETVAPEYLHLIQNARNDALYKGLPYDVLYPIIQKNTKQQKWLRVVGKSTLQTQNKPASFIGIVLDVTKEVESRLAIEESEKRFRNLAEATDILIAVSDENDDFVYFNEAWKQLTGLNMQQLIDQEWLNQIHPDDREILIENTQAAKAKKIPFSGELRLKNINKEYRWLLMKALPRFNSDNSFEGYISSAIDITERKKDEQRKNDFIGMVSHELKTPLTAINGFVQVLNARAQKTNDEYYANALGKTLKQVKKMTALINGFLNVSRLESGKLLIEKNNFDINQLLNEIIEESDLIQYSHTINLQSEHDIFVHADKDKIGSVISNLISNAIKYSDIGTHINVFCAKRNNMVIVSIQDQGIGISEEDCAKLFERYYRVGTNHTISGFGIGLYLCSEIIEQHQGTIWVESEINKGSTFHFSLPLSQV